MDQLMIFLIVWSVVIILIPFERIRELSIVAVIAWMWMVFVDNASTALGYYSYQSSLISIGKAPLFQNLAEAGIGILMINWLRENSMTKLLEVFTVALGFVLLHSMYIERGTFSYGSFDPVLDFIHHVAALSVFIWLSLLVTGEDKVYFGKKFRS